MYGGVGMPSNDFDQFNQRQYVRDAFENQYNGYQQDPMGEEEPLDDGLYMQKERELKELNDLRIRTLEKLVREKVDIIQAQESDLALQAQDLDAMKRTLGERESLVSDFETRLDKAKAHISQRESEIAALKTQLMDMYD